MTRSWLLGSEWTRTTSEHGRPVWLAVGAEPGDGRQVEPSGHVGPVLPEGENVAGGDLSRRLPKRTHGQLGEREFVEHAGRALLGVGQLANFRAQPRNSVRVRCAALPRSGRAGAGTARPPRAPARQARQDQRNRH